MMWFDGVLMLTCAMMLKAVNGDMADQTLVGLTKRLALMTNRLNTSLYSLNSTDPKGYTAQVFADASNVTYTYKQYFIVSDEWRWAMPNTTLRYLRLDVLHELKRFFEAAAKAVDAEVKPFGGRECGLLPAELRRFTAENNTVSPRLSVTLYALAHELDVTANKVQTNQELTGGDVHGGIMNVCETIGVDRVADFFKPTLKLLGPECANVFASAAEESSFEKAMKEYAGSHYFTDHRDNGCLQLFVARYTNRSAEAIELLQRSLYIHMYTTRCTFPTTVSQTSSEVFRTQGFIVNRYDTNRSKRDLAVVYADKCAYDGSAFGWAQGWGCNASLGYGFPLNASEDNIIYKPHYIAQKCYRNLATKIGDFWTSEYSSSKDPKWQFALDSFYSRIPDIFAEIESRDPKLLKGFMDEDFKCEFGVAPAFLPMAVHFGISYSYVDWVPTKNTTYFYADPGESFFKTDSHKVYFYFHAIVYY